jgi:hypothetical protein
VYRQQAGFVNPQRFRQGNEAIEPHVRESTLDLTERRPMQTGTAREFVLGHALPATEQFQIVRDSFSD